MHSMSLPINVDDKQMCGESVTVHKRSPKSTKSSSTPDNNRIIGSHGLNQPMSSGSTDGKPSDSSPPSESHDFQSLVDFHKMLGSSPGSGTTMESPEKKMECHMPLPILHMPSPSASTSSAMPAVTASGNICQICHKQFQRWDQLKRHLITHTDYRPYDCKVCGKRFQLQNKMQRHELTHSGVKPHQCPLCSVKVSRKEHLRRHMLVHSEAKPYKCSMCDHTARRLDSIQGHVKQKHGEATATVVSLFKDPDYLESIDALSRSLEQGIQPPPSAHIIPPGTQPIKKPKKKGSRKRKRSNPMQVETCTQTDEKGDNNTVPSTGTEVSADEDHRANTSVFPEFMARDKLDKLHRGEGNKLKSNPLNNGETKNADDKMENYMMQNDGNGIVKAESELPWQQAQHQGFVSSANQSLPHPSQLVANQALYTGQTPLRHGPPLLPSNQAVGQSYWPEQTRFGAPGYPLSQTTLSSPMMPSVDGGVSMQSAYFNSAGFCPYPAVAMNPNANIPIGSSPHLFGQNVPDFFRKKIRQGTQELNKMCEEITCTSAK